MPRRRPVRPYPSETPSGRARSGRPIVSVTIATETLADLDEWAQDEGGRGRVIDRLVREERTRRGRSGKE